MNRPTPLAARRGFTLIELLTVIAIIGILAAILIPVVGKVRTSAREAQCLSNVRQLASASLLFANENRNVLPPPQPRLADWPDQPRLGSNLHWFDFVVPYMRGTQQANRTNSTVLLCPADTRNVFTSYGFNVNVNGGGGTNASGQIAQNRGRPVTRIANPSRVYLIADTGNSTGGVPFFTGAINLDYRHGNGSVRTTAFGSPNDVASAPGAVSVGFADGHAARLPASVVGAANNPGFSQALN